MKHKDDFFKSSAYVAEVEALYRLLNRIIKQVDPETGKPRERSQEMKDFLGSPDFLGARLITVRRSHDRDTTKGGHADAIPIAAELKPFLEAAISASPSELVFPRPDGRMMARGIQLELILRRALRRAKIVIGYRHVCRRKGCGHAAGPGRGSPRVSEVQDEALAGRSVSAAAVPPHPAYDGVAAHDGWGGPPGGAADHAARRSAYHDRVLRPPRARPPAQRDRSAGVPAGPAQASGTAGRDGRRGAKRGARQRAYPEVCCTRAARARTPDKSLFGRL